MIPFQTLRRAALIWLATLAAIAIGGELVASPHGLERTFLGDHGYSRRGRWLWPTLDGADYSYEDAQNRARTSLFVGQVWQGAPGQSLWRVVYNGDLTIQVDGITVFHGNQTGPVTVADVPVSWRGSSLKLEIAYKPIYKWGIGLERPEMGIYELGPLGDWRLLPAWRLYPQRPDDQVAQFEAVRATVVLVSWATLASTCLALLVAWALRARLWMKINFWIVMAILALAAVTRGVTLAQRSVADNLFFFVIPGRDNYIEWSREWLSGQFSLIGSYPPPGMVLFLGAIQHWSGPHFWPIYILCATLGVLSVGAVIWSAWLPFGRRAGIAAGLLAALYSPLIFFHTTPGADSVFASLAAFTALAGAFWAKNPSIRNTILFGALVGVTGLVKPISVVFGLALLIAIVASRAADDGRGWPWALRRATALAASMVIVIGSLPFLDRINDQPVAFSAYGANTFYMGNNRQADGMTVSAAYSLSKLRGQAPLEAAWSDIAENPLRELFLMMRKVGLFWDKISAPDLFDYTGQGLTRSPFLDAISLGRSVGMVDLSALAFCAMAYLVIDPQWRVKPFSHVLIGMIILLMGSIVIFHVTERFQIMAVPLLCIAGGLTLDKIVGAAQARALSAPLMKAIGLAAVGLAVCVGMRNYLPPKETFQQALPAAALKSDVTFDGDLRLLGYMPLETDTRPIKGGSSSYIVATVFWKAVQPMPEDYKISIQAEDRAGRMIAASDVFIGSVAYPTVGTSRWPPGARFKEEYILFLPSESLPQVVNVNMIVYAPSQMRRLEIWSPDGMATGDELVKLGTVGLITPAGMPMLAGDVTDTSILLGDALRITGLRVPPSVAYPNDVMVGIRWMADKPIYEDYVVFFHLLDEDNKLVAQSDDIVLTGDWTTSALIPGMPVGGERSIELPVGARPGLCRLLMGAYRYPSLERLSASSADGMTYVDGLIELGWIKVK